MKIEIVQATLQDIEKLSVLFDNYRVFYKQTSDIKLAKAFLIDRISNQESVIFVAKGKSTQLGFTQLYPSFSSVSANRTWILNDLYVLPEYQNLRIGSKLLNHAQQHAKQTLAKGIFLQTAKTNAGAQKLYKSKGYCKQDYISYFLALHH
ncbi:GNAT family N-acetyltransferase [Paraglaciecola marina]|uniref:GNAT family N-acetyltransferase n=1 Tax=Paraglaciecola marina TaxID=2500157 RepID=UPI00197E0127|nr:GNAT family N-acetyltransferase [Paraglaciecola marina]